MPKKTKKELEKLKKEKEEMDDRIAQLKLLVAEKKKKEQSKGVSSNLKEEILKKKKAKAQEKISKARKLDAGIAKHMRDYNLKYYISNKDTEGKELKKQQEKQQKKQVAKKEDELKNLRRQVEKEQEKRTILGLRSEIVGRKKQKSEEKRIRKEEQDRIKELRLKNKDEISKEERLEKKEREQGDNRRQKQLNDRFKEKQINIVNKQITNDFNNLFKQYDITSWDIFKSLFEFFKDIQTGRRIELSYLRKYPDGSKQNNFENYDAVYPLIEPEDIDRSLFKKNLEKIKEILIGSKKNIGKYIDINSLSEKRKKYYKDRYVDIEKIENNELRYLKSAFYYDKELSEKYNYLYGDLDHDWFFQGWKYVEDFARHGQWKYLEGIINEQTYNLFTNKYTFEHGRDIPFLYKNEIDSIVKKFEPEYVRMSKIVNLKRTGKKKPVFDSDFEYDTESTIDSDFTDYDSEFEGKLDREDIPLKQDRLTVVESDFEDKPLKQGRLTVVDDKPRVFIDDKSFLF